MSDSPTQTPLEALANHRGRITPADVVTLGGYALGLWWCSGGPTWAAFASMALDELDSVVAARTGGFTLTNDALNWGADIALTPMALYRLSKELGRPNVAAVGAPVALAVQARLKATDATPPVGSLRALVMLAAIAVKSDKRPNPSRRKRRQR